MVIREPAHRAAWMDKKNEEMGFAQRSYHKRQKIMTDPVGAQEDQLPQLRERGEGYAQWEMSSSTGAFRFKLIY